MKSTQRIISYVPGRRRPAFGFLLVACEIWALPGKPIPSASAGLGREDDSSSPSSLTVRSTTLGLFSSRSSPSLPTSPLSPAGLCSADSSRSAKARPSLVREYLREDKEDKGLSVLKTRPCPNVDIIHMCSLRTGQGCGSLLPGSSESECSLKTKPCTYCLDLAAYRHNEKGKDKLKRATHRMQDQ